MVSNPISEGHVVHVHPGQDFILEITDDFGDYLVQTTSSILRKVDEAKVGNATRMRYAQSFDLTNWAKLSRAHLGDIAIVSEKNDCIANVSLVLEAEGKNADQNVLTVINPMSNKIKVCSGQVLHFVLFDYGHVTNEEWGWTLVQREDFLDVNLRLLGSGVIRPNQWPDWPSPDSVFDSMSLQMETPLRRSPKGHNTFEHHLWMKCEAGVPIILPNQTHMDVGNLVFDLTSNPGNFRFCCDILLNLRNKKLKQAQKKQGRKGGGILVAGRYDPDEDYPIGTTVPLIRPATSGGNHHHGHSHNKGYSTKSTSNSYTWSHWHSHRQRQKIKLVEKGRGAIDDHAKVIYLKT